MKPYQGLEIVVPKRFPRKQIPRILQQHQAWITKQLEKYGDSFRPAPLPSRIELGLTGMRYQVEYQQASRPSLVEIHDRLRISHSHRDQAITLLRGWIRTQARDRLPNMLAELAARHGFDYRKCTLRSQKTRWGSCSSSGTISLNDQLLFLPPASVEYLMLHELCHTKHMNHSPSFWELVAQCEPDFQRMETSLNEQRQQIPDWFLQSLYQNDRDVA